ncbi:hypothetical protein BC834DRAFT_372290 [Gloeopeniophorella convolvens]|nr:hypothetical protein BC834DRAFT_372290 [Gloeopeniophorella convolvens]
MDSVERAFQSFSAGVEPLADAEYESELPLECGVQLHPKPQVGERQKFLLERHTARVIAHLNYNEMPRELSRRANVPFPKPVRGRYQIYGFLISREWLIQAGNDVMNFRWKHREKLPPYDWSRTDPKLMAEAVESIGGHALVPVDVDYAIAPSLPEDEEKPDTLADFPESLESPEGLWVLRICTDHAMSYNARPAQYKVDRLTSAIGLKPRWWISSRISQGHLVDSFPDVIRRIDEL